MKKLLVLTTALFNTANVKKASSDIIVPQTKDDYSECFGSLLVETRMGAEKRFKDSKKLTRFNATSLEVEGCGCFVLYQRTKFKGTSELITHHMGNVATSEDYFGFTVRSVDKVPCDYFADYARDTAVLVKNNVKTRPGVDKVKPKGWFKYSLQID